MLSALGLAWSYFVMIQNHLVSLTFLPITFKWRNANAAPCWARMHISAKLICIRTFAHSASQGGACRFSGWIYIEVPHSKVLWFLASNEIFCAFYIAVFKSKHLKEWVLWKSGKLVSSSKAKTLNLMRWSHGPNGYFLIIYSRLMLNVELLFWRGKKKFPSTFYACYLFVVFIYLP